MGNHSALRRRPPDLRQALPPILALLLVVATAVVLAVLLSGREVPPSRVQPPPTSASSTPSAVALVIGEEERGAALSLAATAAEQIIGEIPDAVDLMTPHYARLYRHAVDGGTDPAAPVTIAGAGLMGIDGASADVLVLVDRAEDPSGVVLHLRRYRSQWRVDDLVPVTAPVDHLTEPDAARRAQLAAAQDAVPGEALAAGLAVSGPDAATVLVATRDRPLRVELALVDGSWRAEVAEVGEVSAD
ncbi:hypothetical protein [Nocardioides nitrophenolicus]|uniref:hypothetical protein n=1 Tax=Nocardioides nitrophenolicus TaxID=60489 RepID=UPI00195A3ACC|nr:hypothetical protein [Nocardioides nitrophenolicus]MBM7517593.1 hypothetical protein [Nocardioides nitrophenolicus]